MLLIDKIDSSSLILFLFSHLLLLLLQEIFLKWILVRLSLKEHWMPRFTMRFSQWGIAPTFMVWRKFRLISLFLLRLITMIPGWLKEYEWRLPSNMPSTEEFVDFYVNYYFFFKFFFISIEGAMKQWSVWTSIGLTD